MSPESIGIIIFLLMFALMFAGMPVGYSLIVASIVGLVAVSGFTSAMATIATSPYSTVANYLFSIIPLFILMGAFTSSAGLVEDAYDALAKWLGRLPGGLAIATIGGSAFFAFCTGSSLASIGALTKMSLPHMLKHKYDPRLATGCIAAGATLGILIPPSGPMIVLGIVTMTSVGKLFMAGILPGLLMAGLFMLTIIAWVTLRPGLAPVRASAFTWREKVTSLGGVWPIVLLAVAVLGGMWAGIFTPTEAGSAGALLALLVAFFKKRLTKQTLFESVGSSVKTTAMIFAMLIGVWLFNTFLATSRLPNVLAAWVINLPFPPLLILIAMLLFYLIGGCVMEVFALMLVTLPVFFPIVQALGMDPVWFGVLLVIMMELALITPPVGLNVFVIAAAARPIPMYTVFRGIAPFVVSMVVCLALIIAFPQIALFLPDTMKR